MSVVDPFAAPKGPADLWSDATFYDVTLVQMVAALIASGKYAPGVLLMQMAITATTQIMVQSGRTPATLGIDAVTMDFDTFRQMLNRL